jgi:hypothetical protein
LIPIVALVFGFGYRCVREPIFVEAPSPASGVVAPGEIASLSVFPRPEGKRKVKIESVRLARPTKGLVLVDAVARNINQGKTVISQRGKPELAKKLSTVEFQAGNGYYLILELQAATPGAYRARGVNVRYRSGIQRGTHHMKVTLSVKVEAAK